MIPLRLYNTLDRRKVAFQPLQAGRVGLYSCGPTVYDTAHLGNMRHYLFVDTLRRVLAYRGLMVQHVMNITDVGHLTDDADAGDDKVEAAAQKSGKSAWEVAKQYEAEFWRDSGEFGITRPHVVAHATKHVNEQIALIEQLEAKGYTYETSDGVYFDTSKFPEYGKLARLQISELKEGARIGANPEKRNPTDFALWKYSEVRQQAVGSRQQGASVPRRQMEWHSPWGKGFPGWHIECSAMSTKYLGQPFDIHTGGIEHVPVHHTNEIAQSEAATGKVLANYWLHADHLLANGGKMAKSAGTRYVLADLIERGYDPLAFRYFVLEAHYRRPLNFTWEALESASRGLANLRRSVAELTGEPTSTPPDFEAEFLRAISDDLNTPQALALLHEVLKNNRPDSEKLAAVVSWDRVFSLDLERTRRVQIPDEILKKFRQYKAARQAKNFELSDKLRREINEAGFLVEDQIDSSSTLTPQP